MRQQLSIEILKHELRLAAYHDCDIERDTGSPSAADVERIDKSTSLIFEHLDDLRECALLTDPMFSTEHAVASRIHTLFLKMKPAGRGTTSTCSTQLEEYAARAAKIITNGCEP
jgi:hypothetical protein